MENQRRKITEITSFYEKDHKSKKGISILFKHLTDPDKCTERENIIVNDILGEREDSFKRMVNNIYSDDINITLANMFSNQHKHIPKPIFDNQNECNTVHQDVMSILDIFKDMNCYLNDNNLSKIEDVHEFVIHRYSDKYNDSILRKMIANIYFNNKYFINHERLNIDQKPKKICAHKHNITYYPFSVSVNEENEHYQKKEGK